jgi:2-polyprenyl-3-methyl-5-hydroxy-6-metoxy-1,4-benzoquinol methylase
MEEVNCNLCQANDYKVIWSESPYQVVKCRRCGLVYNNPRLTQEELASFYSPEYFHRYYLPNREKAIQEAEGRLQEIECLVDKGRVLDFGCGMGFFLVAAKKRGWETVGIEISPYASEYASKEFELSICKTNLKKASLLKESFDLVTFWNVLGAVVDPKSLVIQANRILRKNGLIVIQVNHRHRLILKTAYWASKLTETKGILHVPAQVFHFTPHLMSQLLKEAQFSVVKVIRVHEKITRFSDSSLKNLLMKAFDLGCKQIGMTNSFIIIGRKTA